MSEPFVAPPESFVDTKITDKVGIITLNHPAKRNALSEGVLNGITEALRNFAAEGARVVIIRAGSDCRVWSAGHDISELPRGGVDPLRYADPLERTLREIRSFPTPVIAMVHGSVWGGAFDLVLSCDMIVADATATFAITPVNLGLPYNTTGLLHFIGRLPLNLIKEMFFTASPIKADVAMQWGVVNHLVAEEELESFTLDLASHMATKAPLAVAVIKEQLRVLTDFQPIAAQVFERIQDMRRTVYESADYKEGITAFEQKRKPVFTGQ